MFGCTHFVTPCNGDYFSELAIKTLGRYLPKWVVKHRHYAHIPPLFIGYIYNNYSKNKRRDGGEATAFATFRERIENEIIRSIISVPNNEYVLQSYKMIYAESQRNPLTRQNYISQLKLQMCLGSIPDFNMLGPAAHSAFVPIYDISHRQMRDATGNTLGPHYQEQKSDLLDCYEEILNNILRICFIRAV